MFESFFVWKFICLKVLCLKVFMFKSFCVWKFYVENFSVWKVLFLKFFLFENFYVWKFSCLKVLVFESFRVWKFLAPSLYLQWNEEAFLFFKRPKASKSELFFSKENSWVQPLPGSSCREIATESLRHILNWGLCKKLWASNNRPNKIPIIDHYSNNNYQL